MQKIESGSESWTCDIMSDVSRRVYMYVWLCVCLCVYVDNFDAK